MSHVDESADAFLGDLRHCGVELLAAVTSLATEDVAGEALGVDADEGGSFGVDVSYCEGDVLGWVDVAPVRDASELAPAGGKSGFGDPSHERLAAESVRDHVCDGDDWDVVFLCDLLKLRAAGHCTVVVHDLADDGGGPFACGPDEIDGAFGVSGADEDAAFLVTEREDVAGLDEVIGCCFGFGEEPDGVGAVC